MPTTVTLRYDEPMPILTARKETFVQHYFAHRDGPAAYRSAFEVRPETTDRSIATAASKLLALPEIVERLDELRAAADVANPVTLTVGQALERFVTIALANPDELIGLRVGCCRYCHGEGNGYQWREREYLAALDEAETMRRRDPKGEYPLPDIGGGFGFRVARPPNPDCPECDGEGVERVIARDTSKLSPGAQALFGGVKKTRNGLEVIIADRMKALENATRMLGGFNDKLQLTGGVGAMIDWVRNAPKDPQAAARAYQELIAKPANAA